MEAVLTLLIVLICICYFGIGFIVCLTIDMSDKLKFGFSPRVITILLWPITLIVYLIKGQ